MGSDRLRCRIITAWGFVTRATVLPRLHCEHATRSRPMRATLSRCVLLAIAGSAPAHFIWLVPQEDKGTALMIFSDTLEPDANVAIKKIAHTKLFARSGVKGEALPVKTDDAKDAYRVTVDRDAEGPVIVGGVCRYGVISKGKGDPFLLMYYPKAILWLGSTRERPELLF